LESELNLSPLPTPLHRPLMAAAASTSSPHGREGSTSLAGLSGASSHSALLRKLTDELVELLREQAELSREVNKLLTDPDTGLNEVSRRTRKNLEAAVSASGLAGWCG
jgi:hypothetical protein